MPNYWLFKSEPTAYSWDDLVADDVAEWDGVRNYTARNFLRDDIKPGDQVLFYHSSTNPPCVVGIAEVVREGYPDDTAWAEGSEHPDPKSRPESPIWYMVDIKPVRRLQREVPLEEIRATPELAQMALIRYGRLSVTPVTADEFELILKMAAS